jgi:hypothetical protein
VCAGAGGADAVVVDALVMTRTLQNHIFEQGCAASCVVEEVVCLEFAGGRATWVLAVF